jgi:hypothetical protein
MMSRGQSIVISGHGTLLLLIVALFGCSGEAQAPPLERLSKAVDTAAALSARVYDQLHSYDRVLHMRFTRGAIDGRQSVDLLRERADDLAKGKVTDAMERNEEQQEAKLYFEAIERAAASAQWPSLYPPEYYRAYASAVLERTRAEHAEALKNDGNAAQPLDDAYHVLMLARGREETQFTPFNNPSADISSAMDMPNSSDIPTVTALPSRLEFGVRRPGQDIAVMQLATSNPGECRSACQKDARCRGFSFQYPDDDGQNGVCALKASVAPPQVDICCVSWIKK